MEETCHLGTNASIHIVDKGIKNPCLSLQRYHVIVCNGSRNECAITLFQKGFFTSAPNFYLAITLNAHGNDKTIVFLQIPMEGL